MSHRSRNRARWGRVCSEHPRSQVVTLRDGTSARLRPIQPEEAAKLVEVALTTVDDWQGVGIGTALATDLARRCSDAGITSWNATFFMGNKGSRKCLARSGLRC